MSSNSLGPHNKAAVSRLFELTEQLSAEFAKTAIVRDRQGGNAKIERDLLRESGLLNLIIPESYGGHGVNWQDTLQMVRSICRADSSLGHLFGFQHLLLATIRLYGNQWPEYYRKTVQGKWFWGNTLNPLDTRATITPDKQDWRVNGIKSFCSGATDSDYLIVSAFPPNGGKLVVAAIPSNRAGIKINSDWDNMGQRQTDSGSVEFHDVRILDSEILRDPGPLGTEFAGLRSLIAQLVLTNIYIGIAEGALTEARSYTKSQSRAWFRSGVEYATSDPYVLHKYGEFWVELNAAILATDYAAHLLDLAWLKEERLTESERAQAAVAASTAKVLATRAGLDITQRLFEVTGARATQSSAAFDRFWRNLRTHSLHDPVDYKLLDLGEWVLNGKSPTPGFYS
ncbi:acyl-CoA dehydrogenase family protein [Candidatus Methylospira mobilis]|uniref:acyl-CoA dehydrogenase family protein n=1 Tax=Candidatus Methylospira mobilis TaxID=1808979 RepID=UPI0028EEADAE|nr:acyl-CoA dehydrogenase family protein [Candidatus Methylospira mobilis]WNV03585.1 acyl-CoA dehydrogenase family protein [Candidatus Methylospira mobilis]